MTNRVTSKHSGVMGFHSLRKYKVVWFYDLEGVERSYRWKIDDASQRTEKLLKQGFTLKCDPFEAKPLRRVYD